MKLAFLCTLLLSFTGLGKYIIHIFICIPVWFVISSCLQQKILVRLSVSSQYCIGTVMYRNLTWNKCFDHYICNKNNSFLKIQMMPNLLLYSTSYLNTIVYFEVLIIFVFHFSIPTEYSNSSPTQACDLPGE